ncbi:MAG: hypothetical protein QOF62_582 [Pyrinomonadaceae bacterium]|jgi:hypothetical protein|nr:hypothetical protein [Pyrinomonadaceae bacterium]
MTPFFQVVDNFYRDPNRIRSVALSLTFAQPEGVLGWRTRAYQPKQVRQLIERRFRVRTSYWERDMDAVEACNGVFLSAFSQGSRAERVGIHSDEPADWMMFLIYLTPNAPRNAGTSFWQHRETALTCRPTKKDAERIGRPLTELRELLEEDGTKRSRWLEIDRVSNRFNRAVMFPSGLLHSATHHFGSNTRNGRLYQSFHFPIKS